MKQKLLQITDDQVDQMMRVKWGRLVDSLDYPSYLSFAVVGKVFGIDGSSVRRLILRRFADL